MKNKNIIILLCCVALFGCTKKDPITVESYSVEKAENKSNFDEDFYKRVNYYFSLYRSDIANTLDNYRIFNFFEYQSTYKQEKIKTLKVYEINELNKNYYLMDSFIYKNGCVIEREGNNTPKIFIAYDNEKRQVNTSSESGKNTKCEYINDLTNNTYIRIDSNGNKIIIKKTDYGYELQDYKSYETIFCKYYYCKNNLEKCEIIYETSKYTYEYKYLENHIVARETSEKYSQIEYDYEEINFLDNNTIEIIQHADSNNPERRIVLSEFDQYDNWCLAEEFRDGKFYAKYKRVFEYIE